MSTMTIYTKEINMTERQQTGLWFILTGFILLSLWTSAFAIVNWSIDSGFLFIQNSHELTDEQRYVVGASGVAALELISLTGIPFLITGLAQLIVGAPKSRKKAKK